MDRNPNLNSLCSHTWINKKWFCAAYNLYNSMFSPLCITEADGWGPTLQSGGNQLIGLREIDMVPAANPSSPPHSPSVLLCNYPIDWLVLIAGLIIAGFSQLPSQQLSSEVNKCRAYTLLRHSMNDNADRWTGDE